MSQPMDEHSFGEHVSPFALVPFALMLGAIAFLPLVAPHFWESNRNKAWVTAIISFPSLIYLLAVHPPSLGHAIQEYLSFVCLLGSLYVVTGGIHIGGDLEGQPATNTAILGVGAILANLIGTTGASMLLIHPLLRTNSQRKHRAHIPFFFILVVSNAGGLLTPLGDPPLFLGYLRGVPFQWTLRLFPYWLIANSYLLTLFYFIDRSAYRKESPRDVAMDKVHLSPLRIHGMVNFLCLLGVLVGVFFESPTREIIMVLAAAASLFLCPSRPRQENKFSWHPVFEVVILFLGIFITMSPALALLKAKGSQLGITEAWHFFLATGLLSSILDNAPTYLTFFSAAQGLAETHSLPKEVVGMPVSFLTGISLGAVLMGANTYIGNGPNFMVKAIASAAGYETPSFFRYALSAVLFMLPIYLFIVVSLL